MHDKPQTFLTVVDKKTVHSLVLYGVAICVRSFQFTMGVTGMLHFKKTQCQEYNNTFLTLLQILENHNLTLTLINIQCYDKGIPNCV